MTRNPNSAIHLVLLSLISFASFSSAQLSSAAFGVPVYSNSSCNNVPDCRVIVPQFTEFYWSSQSFAETATTTPIITATTFYFYHGNQIVTSVSTLPKASYAHLATSTTTETTITRTYGPGNTLTTVITYPTPFFDYDTAYTVSGAISTSSRCVSFFSRATFTPSSHPPYSQLTNVPTSPSDPIGSAYILTSTAFPKSLPGTVTVTVVHVGSAPDPSQAILSATSAFYKSAFSDQQALEECSGPASAATMSIVETESQTVSALTHTSVALLTQTTSSSLDAGAFAALVASLASKEGSTRPSPSPTPRPNNNKSSPPQALPENQSPAGQEPTPQPNNTPVVTAPDNAAPTNGGNPPVSAQSVPEGSAGPNTGQSNPNGASSENGNPSGNEASGNSGGSAPSGQSSDGGGSGTNGQSSNSGQSSNGQGSNNNGGSSNNGQSSSGEGSNNNGGSGGSSESSASSGSNGQSSNGNAGSNESGDSGSGPNGASNGNSNTGNNGASGGNSGAGGNGESNASSAPVFVAGSQSMTLTPTTIVATLPATDRNGVETVSPSTFPAVVVGGQTLSLEGPGAAGGGTLTVENTPVHLTVVSTGGTTRTEAVFGSPGSAQSTVVVPFSNAGGAGGGAGAGAGSNQGQTGGVGSFICSGFGGCEGPSGTTSGTATQTASETEHFTGGAIAKSEGLSRSYTVVVVMVVSLMLANG